MPDPVSQNSPRDIWPITVWDRSPEDQVTIYTRDQKPYVLE